MINDDIRIALIAVLGVGLVSYRLLTWSKVHLFPQSQRLFHDNYTQTLNNSPRYQKKKKKPSRVREK